ncbi:hypothetical protein FB45DRAFT_898126, partial [Roridomyces roridus]
RPPHPPGCLCSNCHLSAKLFPRGPNDRIMLPAIRPTPGMHDARTEQPKSPTGSDRARMAPPRPQSTAPGEYRPRHHAPPPMPPLPTSMPRGGYDPSSNPHGQQHHPSARGPPPPHDAGYHRFAVEPPERPATAMGARRRHDSLQQPPPPAREQPAEQQAPGEGNMRLKWVKKKERVSHFTPPSQYQGTSFRQYVHDGVSRH